MMSIIIINKLVYIRDEEKVKLVVSLSNDPKTILSSNNISYSEHDNISHEKTFLNIATINIQRSNIVTLSVDGQVKKLHTIKEEPLKNLLSINQITLGPDDIVSENLDTIVDKDLEVSINRVSFSDVAISSSLPFSTDYNYSPLLKKGQSQTVLQGVNGESISKVRQKIIDGVIVEETEIEKVIVKEPINQKVIVGDSAVPISNLNFSGRLELYKKGATATAYSAKKGTKTASGMNAEVGHVAVNAKLIPYGSKLYIKATNGTFIYGYAVAADTGAFALDNKVDVDLFFETYDESCLFGKQAVDIYIVK